MKSMIVVLLGVFIAMLLAIPVLAETDVTSTMNAAASSPGGISIDTQSPVLDGAAYTNYDTVFLHGAMAVSHKYSTGVYSEGDWADCHDILLKPSSGNAFVNCPYFSYDSKQEGIQPRVRYLGLQFKTFDAAEIYAVDLWNGGAWVDSIEFNPPLKSTTAWSLRVIDLGAWYRFDRGLNMCVAIRNPSTTSYGTVRIAGYGARFEW